MIKLVPSGKFLLLFVLAVQYSNLLLAYTRDEDHLMLLKLIKTHRSHPTQAIELYQRITDDHEFDNNLKREAYLYGGLALNNAYEAESLLDHIDHQFLNNSDKGSADDHFLYGKYFLLISQEENAFDQFEEALSKYRSNSDVKGESMALLQIAKYYLTQEETEESIVRLKLALKGTVKARDTVLMAEAYKEIARFHLEAENVQESLNALDSAIMLGHLADDPMVLHEAYHLLGNSYRKIDDFQKALRAYQNQLSTVQSLNENGHRIDSANPLRLIGGRMFQLSFYDSAIHYYQRSIQVNSETNRDTSLVLKIYPKLARCYKEIGDYKTSILNFHAALSLSLKKERHDLAGWALLGLGEVSQERGDFLESINYFNRALDEFSLLSDDFNNLEKYKAWVYTYLGMSYSSLEQFQKANDYLTTALDFFEGDSSLNSRSRAKAMHYLGMNHYLIGLEFKARTYLMNSTKLQKKLKNYHFLAEGYNTLSKIYLTSQPEMALIYADSALLALKKSSKSNSLSGILYQQKSLCFEHLGIFDSALFWYKMHKVKVDSVFELKKEISVDSLVIKYKTAEQIQKIEVLEQQGQIRKLYLFSLVVLSFFVMLAGYFFYYRLKVKSKSFVILNEAHKQLKETQAKLVESEKMASLGQLTAGIAHEINNPMNFVQGGIESIKVDLESLEELIDSHVGEKEKNLIGEINQLIKTISEGARRTIQIVSDLRTYSRLDEDVLKRYNIEENLEVTLRLLGRKITDKHEIVVNVGNINDVYVYPGKINQVFTNLIVNALDATEQMNEPRIKIEALEEENFVIISVADNGPGISDEIKSKIFDPFYTTKPIGKGTGLGLSICKSIVQMHNGELYYKESMKGTTFVFSLPKLLVNS